MVKTKIITLDGHDNVGKTSLISLCSQHIISSHKTVRTLQTVDESFNRYRERVKSTQENPWFYISAWMQTEKKVREDLGKKDYVLIDRSYYSTYVLCRTKGIEFPDFILEYLLKPDIAIQIVVDESLRLKRMKLKKDLDTADIKTKNQCLIKIADEIYDTLCLCKIYNNGPIESTALQLYNKIK